MLVKLNSIETDNNKVKLTHLDIDDHGSLIPLKELELCISANALNYSGIEKSFLCMCFY
jgi:hypothetical protein